MNTMIEELKRLDKAATPGPWLVEEGDYPLGDTGDYDTWVTLRQQGGEAIADMIGPTDDDIASFYAIATLRNNIPSIIAQLEAAEAMREKLAGIEYALRSDKDNPPLYVLSCIGVAQGAIAAYDAAGKEGE